MPQNVETYLRNLQTSDSVRADAWDALNSDDPKVVEQQLRNVKGLTDNLKAKLWDLKFPAAPAAEPTEPADPYDANLVTKAVGMGRSFLGGIGQGVASTVLHIDDAARALSQRYAQPDASGNVRQIPRPLHDNPDVQAAITPYNTASAVGKGAEQAAEFAIPGGAVGKLTKASNLATRAGAQALSAGVVATAQQGDVKAATVPAIVAGATPVAGAAVRGVAERTLYPAVRTAIAPGGVLDDFFTNVGLRPPKQAVAGQTAANLDEALRQVREVGIRGTRGDWDKIAKWMQSRREQFAQARQRLQAAGQPTESMRKAAQDLRAEEDMLHRLSEELAKHHPETGFSPFGTGGLGYLFGGPQAGVPLAIAEAIRKRFPAWSATQMDRAASLLGAPGTAGVMGGLTSTTLQDELMRRELEGDR